MRLARPFVRSPMTSRIGASRACCLSVLGMDGTCAHLQIAEQLLQVLMSFGRDGMVLPLPNIQVRKHVLNGCEMAIVEVTPSDSLPVKYKGRVCVRFGPARAFATPEQERRLVEQRRNAVLPFDQQPIRGSTVHDLDSLRFSTEYLPSAVPPDVLAQNNREMTEQLKALRLLTPDGIPSVAGILVLGRDPRQWLPCDYVQFVRYAGAEITETIRDQKEIDGALSELLRRLDEVIEANIQERADLPREQ
jgi:ATP-dependent DNA helicase RecG